MNAAVPLRAIEILSPFFDPGSPWGFDLRFQQFLGTVTAIGPCSVGPRNVVAVTARGAGRNLRPIGRSFHGTVILHPEYGNLETAAGLALLGHEKVHQDQFDTIPNFESLYARANAKTDPNRPWENTYERPAYIKEAGIFCALVAMGFPPGDWTPLGVEVFGCPG